MSIFLPGVGENFRKRIYTNVIYIEVCHQTFKKKGEIYWIE